MNLPDALQLAQLAMIDAEAHGFEATAQAMRNVVNEMLLIQRGIEATTTYTSPPRRMQCALH